MPATPLCGHVPRRAACDDPARVAAIGAGETLRARWPDAEVLGGEGFVAIPGLINAHHHFGTTPLQLGSPDHPLELLFATRLGLRDVDLRLDTSFPTSR